MTIYIYILFQGLTDITPIESRCQICYCCLSDPPNISPVGQSNLLLKIPKLERTVHSPLLGCKQFRIQSPNLALTPKRVVARKSTLRPIPCNLHSPPWSTWIIIPNRVDLWNMTQQWIQLAIHMDTHHVFLDTTPLRPPFPHFSWHFPWHFHGDCRLLQLLNHWTGSTQKRWEGPAAAGASPGNLLAQKTYPGSEKPGGIAI